VQLDGITRIAILSRDGSIMSGYEPV